MLKSIRSASFNVRKALGSGPQDHNLEVLSAHAANVEKLRKQCLGFVRAMGEFVKGVEVANASLADSYPNIEVLAPVTEMMAAVEPSVTTSTVKLDALRALIESRCVELVGTIRATKDMVNDRNLKASELHHYEAKLKKLEGSAKEKDVDRMARNQHKAEEMSAALVASEAEVDTAMSELDSRLASSLNDVVLQVLNTQAAFFAEMHGACHAAQSLVDADALAAPRTVTQRQPVTAPESPPLNLQSPVAAAAPSPPPVDIPEEEEVVVEGEEEEEEADTTQATAPTVAAPEELRVPPPLPARRLSATAASAPSSGGMPPPPLPRRHASMPDASPVVVSGAARETPLGLPPPPPPPTMPPPELKSRTYVGSPLLVRTGHRSSFSGGSVGGATPPPPLPARRRAPV